MAKSFIFDGEFYSADGLGFEFERDWGTVDEEGESLNDDKERYTRRTQLICGAPKLEYPILPGLGYQVVGAGGFDADSTTPLLLYLHWASVTLYIFETEIDLSNANSHRIYMKNLHYGYAPGNKRGQADLLQGEPDEDTDLIYVPHSFGLCHGLALASCDVRRKLTPISFTVTDADPYGVIGGRSVWALTTTPSTIDVYDPRLGNAIFLSSSSTGPFELAPRLSTSIPVLVYADSDPLAGLTLPTTATIPQWEPFATAVCYWQAAENKWYPTAYTDGVTTTLYGPEIQPSKPRGSDFNACGHRVIALDNGDVLSAYFPVGDYAHSFGGDDPWLRPTTSIATFFLLGMTRLSVTDPWTCNYLMPVISLETTLTIGQHAHACYVERYGTDGMRLVCAVGDSKPNNRVCIVYRDNETYAEGPADPDGHPSNGHTFYDDLHGTHQTPSDSTSADGNQFVAHSPVGTWEEPLGHVNGGDETAAAITRLAPLDDGDPADRIYFTHIWGVPAASPNHTNHRQHTYNCFFMRCLYPEWGYQHIAAFNPSSSNIDVAASRILFSPNGLIWGECFAPRGCNSLAFFGENIVFTSPVDTGVRSIFIPAHTTVQPLIVGYGGRNLLIDEPEVLTDSVAGSNDVEQIGTGDLPDGVPQPPCMGPIMRCTTPESGGAVQLGVLRLTGTTIPHVTNGTHIKLRAYIYVLGESDGGAANSVALEVALGNWAALGSSRESFVMAAIQFVGDPVGGWFPITLDTNTYDWKTDTGSNGRPTVGLFTLALRILNAYNTFSPNAFLIVFDSIVYGDSGAGVEHPGVPLPLGVSYTLKPEKAWIKNFTCGESFTAEVLGIIPDDASDHTVETVTRVPLASRVYCSLVEPGVGAVKVYLDTDNRAVVFRIPDGSGTVDIVVKPNLAADHEEFFFSRGSVIFLGITAESGLSGTRYVCYASVGHTRIYSAESAGATVLAPTRLYLADGDNVEPSYWVGGRIDERTMLSAQDIEDSWEKLDLLPYLTTIESPLP